MTLAFLYISSKKVNIEIFHIASESTHNRHQVGIKIICTEEREKKL